MSLKCLWASHRSRPSRCPQCCSFRIESLGRSQPWQHFKGWEPASVGLCQYNLYSATRPLVLADLGPSGKEIDSAHVGPHEPALPITGSRVLALGAFRHFQLSAKALEGFSSNVKVRYASRKTKGRVPCESR